jgi:hypothetical protein
MNRSRKTWSDNMSNLTLRNATLELKPIINRYAEGTEVSHIEKTVMTQLEKMGGLFGEPDKLHQYYVNNPIATQITPKTAHTMAQEFCLKTEFRKPAEAAFKRVIKAYGYAFKEFY